MRSHEFFNSFQSPYFVFRGWFDVALYNLVLAAFAGAILRLLFLTELPGLSFRPVLHAHSHMALTGWGYIGLSALLMHFFGREFPRQRLFHRLLLGHQVSVLGMFATFPIYGYKAIPIFFSTIHLVLSYIFAYFFLKYLWPRHRATGAGQLLIWAFIFQIISTLAVWVLPLLLALDLRHGALYHMSVQFFLHFQFNGWIIFGVLALYLQTFPKATGAARSLFRAFLFTLVTATLLTYAQAVTWTNPVPVIFYINSAGVLLQVFALFLWLQLIRTTFTGVGQLGGFLAVFALASLVLKIGMQGVVFVPHLAEVSYTIRQFVVGFIHLILLGLLSASLFHFARLAGWLRWDQFWVRFGVVGCMLSFVASEILLFVQGVMLWWHWGFMPAYFEWIFGASVLMVSFLLIVALANTRAKAPDDGQNATKAVS